VIELRAPRAERRSALVHAWPLRGSYTSKALARLDWGQRVVPELELRVEAPSLLATGARPRKGAFEG
jgi:hypothetical protein